MKQVESRISCSNPEGGIEMFLRKLGRLSTDFFIIISGRISNPVTGIIKLLKARFYEQVTEFSCSIKDGSLFE
jgi:hypothetical protein